MASEKRLRILCLHGYRQSEAIFREKTGSFRKGLRKLVDLVYITAPNEVKLDGEGEEHAQYGWWFSSPGNSFSASEKSDIDDGLEKSLSLVRETLRLGGPFDGLLGFSQGAALTSIICALRDKEPSDFNFKFAILASAFISRCTKHSQYYRDQITCPSLHVFGSTDQVIPTEWSEELKSLYQQPVVMCHPGGHYLPATAAERQTYSDYLRQFL